MAEPRATPHATLILVATILASSLAFVDGSVVNVGLPAIGRDLHGDAGALQWVMNGYTLPLTALLLLGGALGDRFGRRTLLVIGTAVFALASAGCAFAPDVGWLIAGRAAQGIGSAMLMPNSLAILGDAYQGHARGRAVGVWAAVGAMMAAVGPVLGGALIDTVGWRAIFLINLPIAAAAIALALRVVPDACAATQKPALDAGGAALASVGLLTITWGLTLGSGPAGWSAGSAGSLVAGLLVFAGFLWVEHLRGDRAMAPLAMFASKSFVGLSLLTLLLYGALGGVLVLLPYVLIEAAGYSAIRAGAALLPFPLVLAALSPLVGGLADKIGPRWPLVVGPMIVAVGYLLLLRIGQGGGYFTQVLPAMLVISLGMAGAVSPLTTAVLGSVDERHTGAASGLNSAISRAGGLVATALLGAILASRGPALIEGFHLAAMIGAAAAAGAGLCALMVANPKPTR